MAAEWNRNTFSNGVRDNDDRLNGAMTPDGYQGSSDMPHVEEMDFSSYDNYSNERYDHGASANAIVSDDTIVPRKTTHKSIVATHNSSDDEATNDQHRVHADRFLYNSDKLNTDDLQAEATGYNAERAADIDADAAYALQLQKEEYAKESMRSFRRPNYGYNWGEEANVDARNPSLTIPSSINPDELLARQLHREERRQRDWCRPTRPYAPLLLEPQMNSRRTAAVSQTEDDDRPEVVAMPPFFRPFHQFSPQCVDDDDDDDESVRRIVMPDPYMMFHGMSRSSRGPPMAFHVINPFQSRYRRGGNLEENEDDFGPEDYERLLQLDDTIKKKKLTKQQIETIKKEKFTRPPNNTDEENQCGICLERFELNESLRRYPCLHLYHQKCSDRWLQENNACPICRKPPVDVATRSNSHSRRANGHQERSNNHQHHRSYQNRSANNRPAPSHNKSSKNHHQS